MAVCKQCKHKGIFLFLNSDGLCKKCQLAKQKAAKSMIRSINHQVKKLEKERNAVLSGDDLTPEEIDGHHRSYHYKDVNVFVVWQYGGQYGKNCKSIGMRRGDIVELVPHRQKEDPDQIAISWRGIEVAHMKTNRLRGMVHQWQAAKLPVLCIVASVGGEQKLLLEFAFYGKPS